MAVSDDEEVYVENIDDREWGMQWNHYSRTHGKLDNIPSATHLRQFLAKLRINLTEKSCQKLMIICQDKGGVHHVHLTTLKSVLQEALDKYTGLPVDQAIGGLIVEFNASEAGRKHRNYQSMQSMQAIVAASTQSLSHYALSKVKESKLERQKRKDQEKLQRQLKREKLYAKQHGTDSKSKKRASGRHRAPLVERDHHSSRHNNNNNSNHPSDTRGSDDDIKVGSDSDAGGGHHSPAHSVIINDTPSKSNDAVSEEFPPTASNRESLDITLSFDKADRLSPAFHRIRSTSSDVAMQRRDKKRSRDMQYFANKLLDIRGGGFKQERDDEKKISLLDLAGGGDHGAGAQQVIEILKRQENMLYRIQTQMNSLERQIQKMNIEDDDDDISSALRECMLELEYLKSSSLNEIRNELTGLKMELFNGFESIAISSAYNVSMDIKQSLHSMNNKISTTVRLWGNDWNVQKRVVSNQEKLDHVLFKASKILRKYQEQQSNLRRIKYGQNHAIRMNVPQFISEMDSIRTSLKGMDHYLNTFVFDRLSRMEDALVRIFQHSSNLADPDNTNSTNRTVKRFSVDELMNQLDSQRLNFEGQLRAKSEKISVQKEELQFMRQIVEKEREKMDREKEEFSNLRAKYEEGAAHNKELEFDLRAMKSQLERLSMFSNEFGTGTGNTKGAIHADIIAKDGDNKNVDLNLEFDRFYTNSLSSLIGDFIAKSKLDNREKANAFHKDKESGHLQFSRDEVPKFLANRNNRDAQQEELEDRLGFGYQELYYLYRENTEINIRCNRLSHENEQLRARLASIEPVVIVQDVATVNVKVQNELQRLFKRLRSVQNDLQSAESKQFVALEEARFIDKYRIEMLQDVKKVEQEIESQMNYDKFQFERQRKKMHALMKSEKEGVLKEREIMEEERNEIEELKAEWKSKLAELAAKEEIFDEKVVLAKSNMNEVVFQKGLTEALRDYRDDLKEELKEIANQEMIREATEDVRSECDEQIAKQRDYYNKRYAIATHKINEINKENDRIKLQISHFKQQIKTMEGDQTMRDEYTEKIQGMYDRMEMEYTFLKEEYKKLEKEKKVVTVATTSDSKEDDATVPSRKKKKKRKNNKRRDGGIPEWLDADSDDDEFTKREKESIGEWLKQRHGLLSKNNKTHWLVLPEDKLAGKDRDIEDLNVQLRQLRHELDNKNRECGRYKQKVADLEAAAQGTDSEHELLNKLSGKHSGIVREFGDHIDTVKKWLKIWQDGIKTVTKAETKWMEKHTELIKKEKQIQKEKEDLIYDQRMWYAHKNHILRRFYYFTKQVWWQRFVQHEFQKARVDQELAWHPQNKSAAKDNNDKSGDTPKKKAVDHRDCYLWNQYFKMMLESWFETGVYQHALTRWFCQYNTYSHEKDLFYYSENDNNEELYVFKDDIMKHVQPHLDSIIERYYKMKWVKRRQKFGRVWITAEKPNIIIHPGFKSQKKITRDLLHLLHRKEPSYHQIDIKNVIKSVMNEMDTKIKGFNRSAWNMVKTLDGVGVVPLAQQNNNQSGGSGRAKTPRSSTKRKSRSTNKIGPLAEAAAAVETVNPLQPIPISTITGGAGGDEQEVATPGGTRKKKKVRIAPKEVGRVSKTMNPATDDVKESEDIQKKREREKAARAKQLKMRESMKTPKASPGEKTWSHAMENFKSVKKRNKKKMTQEEKEKLRQKRKGKNTKRTTKRSSVRNPRMAGVNLLDPNNQNQNNDDDSGSGIKMIKPDI